MSAARQRLRAGAAFTAGLALGAALVFGGLAALGAAISGHAVIIAAVVLAGAAVVSDALGLRVRPQVHFQVPEPWRRTMPLPRALFLYGLLLGTGLTTYVPATAAFALPALSLALGDVTAALAIAAGFAAGRALPVLVLAVRGNETVLAERPRGLRLLRVLTAASLLFALVAGEVKAAATLASPGNDPSAEGTDVAWQEPGVGGFLRQAGTTAQLPGDNPAIGGAYVAWRTGDTITVADRLTQATVMQEVVPGVRQLAVGRKWLVYRTATQVLVQPIGSPPQSPGALVVQTKKPGTLGRPSLDVDLVVFHRTFGNDGSWLTGVNASSGKRLILRRSSSNLLLNPSVDGGQLLYVRVSRCAQQLMLGTLRGKRDRVLYQLPPLAGQDQGHEPGYSHQGERRPCPGHPRPTSKMLWTTALSPTAAYVTVLRPQSGGGTTPTLLSIPRG